MAGHRDLIFCFDPGFDNSSFKGRILFENISLIRIFGPCARMWHVTEKKNCKIMICASCKILLLHGSTAVVGQFLPVKFFDHTRWTPLGE